MPTDPQAINRYAIVRIPEHGPPPDGTVVHGSWPEVMGHFPSSRERNDAIASAAQARADKDEALQLKEEALRAAAEAIHAEADRLAARQDSLAARHRADRRARKKADAEARARAAVDYLDSLPDPDGDQGGELSPVGSVPRDPVGGGADTTDIDDQIPDPTDPIGAELEN
jgi:hypothetical protein